MIKIVLNTVGEPPQLVYSSIVANEAVKIAQGISDV